MIYLDYRHCDGFEQFIDEICDMSVVDNILQVICEFGTGFGVNITARTSLDREGGNHEIVGTVENGDREYAFRVINGNWNGTEVTGWDELTENSGSLFRLTDRSEYYQ